MAHSTQEVEDGIAIDSAMQLDDELGTVTLKEPFHSAEHMQLHALDVDLHAVNDVAAGVDSGHSQSSRATCRALAMDRPDQVWSRPCRASAEAPRSRATRAR